MGKFIRIFIVIIAVLGLSLLGSNNAASASNLRFAAVPSLPGETELTAFLAVVDDCPEGSDRDEGKKGNKCRDKDVKGDAEDDKGQPDDEDDGTVQPPGDDIQVCSQGDYSVGGVATLNAKDWKRTNPCFRAYSQDSGSVSGLPGDGGAALSERIVLEAIGQESDIKICFAAPPGKNVNIYFSDQASWKSLRTQVKNGIACAQAPRAGTYILAGQ